VCILHKRNTFSIIAHTIKRLILILKVQSNKKQTKQKRGFEIRGKSKEITNQVIFTGRIK